MELYRDVSYSLSKLLTERYSTSFSMSSRLFDASIRDDIYAIYGLVRIADEVVDTYRGTDAKEVLLNLETSTYIAIERQYDVNPIIHAFACTAKKYGVDASLIQPFFESMTSDLNPTKFTKKTYDVYIYGSAEVVGLMCLRVFCQNDQEMYERLAPGARSLGAAYQKINFLRDIAVDYTELGRLYFPGVTYDTFDDSIKDGIVKDIETDLSQARQYITQLPSNSQKAVTLSAAYFGELFIKLASTPAEVLKTKRVRISNIRKIYLLASVMFGRRV